MFSSINKFWTRIVYFRLPFLPLTIKVSYFNRLVECVCRNHYLILFSFFMLSEKYKYIETNYTCDKRRTKIDQRSLTQLHTFKSTDWINIKLIVERKNVYCAKRIMIKQVTLSLIQNMCDLHQLPWISLHRQEKREGERELRVSVKVASTCWISGISLFFIVFTRLNSL